MLKAIIFDFDLTLSNRTISFRNALLKRINDYFPEMDEIEKEAIVQRLLYLDEFGTRSRTYSVDYLCDSYGLDREMVQKDFDGLSMAMAKDTILDSDTIPVLEYLKKHTDCKLAILTNGMYESQKAKIDATGIAPYFDLVVMSSETGYQKPDPRAFTYVARHLNVACEECLFVGDVFFNDILGAHKAGMKYVLLNNLRKWSYPQNLPVIEHLRDFIPFIKEYNDGKL